MSDAPLPTRPSQDSPTESDVVNPTPPRPRSLWPPVLLALFITQIATGLLLMTVYTPSTTTAWGSVWYIQTVVPSGAIVRGLHAFASNALLIALVAYVLWMVVKKGYAWSSGCVWVLTLILAVVTLVTALTGELLPWDQAGYWGTKVRLNILARAPVVGGALRDWLIGGREFGNLTLVRFHALHVLVLPAMLAGLLFLRSRLVRRNDSLQDAPGTATSPDPQLPAFRLRSAFVCAFVLAGVLGTVWYSLNVANATWLDAPADPTASDYPARPEWHTLFLYQWLKYFSDPRGEVIGAIVVPSGLLLIFMAFPLVARVLRGRVGHGFAVGVTSATVVAIVLLTGAAVWTDRNPTDARVAVVRAKIATGDPLAADEDHALRARAFNDQRDRAAFVAARAFELSAEYGIPPTGPLDLLNNDPLIRGPELFAAHCASCHRYAGHDGLGRVPSEPADSSDLAGFASSEWILRLLKNPMDDRHFGRMKKPDGELAHTQMSKWVSEQMEDAEDDAAREKLSVDFTAAAAFLERESGRRNTAAPVSTTPNENAGKGEAAVLETPASTTDALIERGREVFMDACNECHSYQGDTWGTFHAPEMFEYGSAGWIERMIADPSDDALYRNRGKQPAQMPAFKDQLSDRDRSLIARWLHDSR